MESRWDYIGRCTVLQMYYCVAVSSDNLSEGSQIKEPRGKLHVVANDVPSEAQKGATLGIRAALPNRDV